MSTERYLTQFPYRAKGICSWCGEPVKPPRQSWCGDACVREWMIRTSGTSVRRYVRERDHGICALCGFDALTVWAELESALWQDENEQGQPVYRRRGWLTGIPTHWLKEERWRYRFPRFHVVADRLGLPMARRNIGSLALWEADHIIPVSEGGGCCGLENYRTLCWRCHAVETARLAVRTVARRGGWSEELRALLLEDGAALFGSEEEWTSK